MAVEQANIARPLHLKNNEDEDSPLKILTGSAFKEFFICHARININHTSGSI